MQLMYVVALSVFLLGLALLTYSTTGGDEVRIGGLIVHARILRGLGIITVIFSAITFLAAVGGTSPPPRAKPKE